MSEDSGMSEDNAAAVKEAEADHENFSITQDLEEDIRRESQVRRSMIIAFQRTGFVSYSKGTLVTNL